MHKSLTKKKKKWIELWVYYKSQNFILKACKLDLQIQTEHNVA